MVGKNHQGAKMDRQRIDSFISKQMIHAKRKENKINYINNQQSENWSFKPQLAPKTQKLMRVKTERAQSVQLTHRPAYTQREEFQIQVEKVPKPLKRKQRSVSSLNGINTHRVKTYEPLFGQ